MFLQYAAPGAILPLQTLRLQELGFSPWDMGVICSTQAIGGLTAPWIIGQVADRWFPAERCLSVCALLAGAILWLLAEITTPVPFFFASLAFWLTMVPTMALGTTISFTHMDSPARQFGPIRLWGTIGWVVTCWLLGYWFTNPGWLCRLIRPDRPVSELADAFRIGGILAFMIAANAFTLPHTPPTYQAAARFAPAEAVKLLRLRGFKVYAVCTLGACMAVAFVSQVTPLLLTDLGIGLKWLTPTMSISQTVEVVALAMLPMLLLRIGMRGALRIGLGAWFLALFVLTLGKPTWLVVASLGLNGLFMSMYIITGQVFVNSRARHDFRASTQGLFAFMTGVGLLTGNLLVGWVRQMVDGAFAPTFGVAAVLTGVLFVVFLIGFPRVDEPERTDAHPVINDIEIGADPSRNGESAQLGEPCGACLKVSANSDQPAC